MKKFLLRLISFACTLRYRLNNRVEFGKDVTANWKLRIKGPGRVVIEDGVNLWSFAEKNQLLTYSKDAVIKIGAGSRINGATIQARKLVEIGENCLMGSALIMDNDFHHTDPAKRFDKTQIPSSPVSIGKNVWVCGQTVILKGVTVGNNSVVALRSVVTKDVAANTVVAGNPAKMVKQLD